LLVAVLLLDEFELPLLVPLPNESVDRQDDDSDVLTFETVVGCCWCKLLMFVMDDKRRCEPLLVTVVKGLSIEI